MAATVLVVEDERKLRDLVRSYLERAGFTVLSTGSGAEAITMATDAAPDLVILDLGLPDVSGQTVARELRASSVTGTTPILMLTAKSAEEDRIHGLELGADDYVTKPFSPRELAVRVRTVLRRASPHVEPRSMIEVSELVLDGGSREAIREGRALTLTLKEFDLLWFLASHPRLVFSRETLMERVWGYQAAFDTGTVTVHMRRLREKIEADPTHPRHLLTVWGVGYRFDP